jgi:hypothetical protein
MKEVRFDGGFPAVGVAFHRGRFRRVVEWRTLTELRKVWW